MRRKIDWAAIDDAIAMHEHVLTHGQLRGIGLSPTTVTRWIGPRGRWQRILPGIVLTHRGTPTRRERLLAALLFAGEGAMITGADALAITGATSGAAAPGATAPGAVASGAASAVQVLVPAERQRTSFDYVRIERTRRLPVPVRISGIPYAPPARAALDTCRALGEIHSGIRSVAEARAREILVRLGVPSPLWNAQLLADGTPLCMPDAYWPGLAAALEIDSLAWHLSPASYRRTKRRERLMVRAGALVISYTPTEILDDPARQVQEFLATAARRPRPEGIVVRRAA